MMAPPKSGKNYQIIDNVNMDDAFADGMRDRCAHKKYGGKIKKSRPDDGIFWRKNTGGNNSGNRIGGIMKSVEEIKNQRDNNQKNDKCH